ncbi:CRTAC1 family protein [Crocinitomix catalasitica]|nr:CRTAC1 family protein [Crocinitomix catalasitica]
MTGGISANAQEFDMKAELKRLAPLDSFPDNAGFYNTQGIKFNKARLHKGQLDSDRYYALYDLSFQYLFAGYPDSAIMMLDSIPIEMWNKAYPSDPWRYDKYMLLAQAYLREGEQVNCQNNHNEFSCIMPLSVEAQHKIKNGSEGAIEWYTKSLDRKPDNYVSRWLLNIAYMTLGQYPDSVPEKYFIDFNHYPQYEDLPYFKNLGGELGVDLLTFYGASIVEDFNNDGFLDIFTTSTDLETNVVLYLSDGKGGYDDATVKADLVGITGGSHATQADYNNDGFVDIYIIRGGWLGERVGSKHPNSLLRNNGDGTFTDVTHEVGLLGYYASHTASWGDFNNDGWLDLFVGSETGLSQLFQNNKGIFEDVAGQTGVYINELVKGSYWGDYNKDGLQDLFVSVSRGSNFLMKNNGPDPSGQYTFINAAPIAGVVKPVVSFPCFFFDFNNDTYLDLFVASYNGNLNTLAQGYLMDKVQNIEYSALFINNKDGTFTDIAEAANLHRSIDAMGMNFGDVDNDGWLDFYVGTGYPAFEALMPNLLFRNNEGQVFQEVTNAGFGHLQKGHGIGFGDLDNDGDQDLYVSLGGFMLADKFWNILLENPGNGNNWITLDLEGVTSNKSAIGAEITIIAEGSKGSRTIHRVVSPGGSFGSSSLQQEIGLGDCKLIKSIEINWPASQTKQLFKKVEINKVYKVMEDSKILKEISRTKIKLGTESGGGHHHHHGHGHHHH